MLDHPPGLKITVDIRKVTYALHSLHGLVHEMQVLLETAGIDFKGNETSMKGTN